MPATNGSVESPEAGKWWSEFWGVLGWSITEVPDGMGEGARAAMAGEDERGEEMVREKNRPETARRKGLKMGDIVEVRKRENRVYWVKEID